MRHNTNTIIKGTILILSLLCLGSASAQDPVKPPKRPTTTQQTKPKQSQSKPQQQRQQSQQSQQPQQEQPQQTEPQPQQNQTPLVDPQQLQQADPQPQQDQVPQVEPQQPHEWVDLGLPSGLKWATCNIGASSPSDYGDYFAWGETSTKTSYTGQNSDWYGDERESLKAQGVVDSKWNLTPQYDAARQKWGGSWRMPTSEEIKELIDKCWWKWTNHGGKTGYKVTGPNGNSIFLPAVGYRSGSDLSGAGSRGNYWSATAFSDAYYAYSLYFISSNHSSSYYNRYYGQSIRPVTE